VKAKHFARIQWKVKILIAAQTMRFRKTVFRASLLALLVFSFPGAAPSRAQEPPTPPQNREAKAAPRRRGPGQQLAHETREAAGEEKDETAEFKQSGSVQFIAHITGLSLSNAYLFSVVFNFVVVAGLIAWAGFKYLPGVFRARTSLIQKAMQEAQKASEDARRRLAEIENRLMRLDGEIGMMRDAAEREAADEEVRIRAAAQEDASKIIASAQQEIASAAKSARRDLAAYAADLAVGLAKKQIHIDAATDQALLRKFAGDLGSPQVSQEAAGKDGH
jgi:F-type H+-transporting ATPase subunit b